MDLGGLRMETEPQPQEEEEEKERTLSDSALNLLLAEYYEGDLQTIESLRKVREAHETNKLEDY
jgi:hypothetical protein